MSHTDMNSKAIFFDVDDTLYDHLTPFRQAVWNWVGEQDKFPFEEGYQRLRYHSDMLSLKMGGAGTMGTGEQVEWMRRERFKLTLAEFGIPLTDEEAGLVQSAYLDCQFRIEMFPGARELLTRLQEEGHVVGLITNGAGEHQRKKIEAMDLHRLLPEERLFISGEAGWDKPDPRLFQLVNEKTGTSPEDSLYIGDSWRNDVVGALGAGWSVVWFNPRGAAAESEHQPHHVVRGYDELSRLLMPPVPMREQGRS
ncbi:HAD family hydrolase [Paenibacillus soyae]|uniref:HAD family hydrolase n=1 Tax=Paenibacillus soyae TaxID=2969249 RepID=A0A9X2MPM8_9BACL|nr:HAD family hydrolase [Paenibacillus soyae]MCR2804564.1 HAD family hydrolase [Paenibacillus soyae]